MALSLMFSFPVAFADSDEREVEIEIEDGVSEIKIEWDDDEYEFKLATSDIDEILDITSLRTGIPVDSLRDIMKLEVKDNDDHDDERDERDEEDDDRDEHDDSNDSDVGTLEKELRVSTLGDSSEVKMEVEFVTDTVDSDVIIDEILENFLVTQEEAEDLLKIQTEDDELEEKFKVEIDSRGGISEVEVELRYVLDSTDRNEIITSIITQSQLDRDLILDAIDSQNDSDDSDSFEDNSDVITDQTFDDSELVDLRAENRALQEENQILREEVNDLREELANLNQVLMEQIRVIMDTLAALRP
ncbi:hypothetical protein NPIRD3C_0549 [Nitrosopumilus piranensis]|uniref:Uncharacterized protein n=1 Tax=Nitrosopumilus piranensis TaxID=1582439 RepID=A0A0C5BPY1_9ARCH|nr:hypothetical protein NPIRD3C_0549 [Nitrosopumilus piranensis]